jgi:hypothetical protein
MQAQLSSYNAYISQLEGTVKVCDPMGLDSTVAVDLVAILTGLHCIHTVYYSQNRLFSVSI